jgi:hypothetical protein
LVNCDSSSLAAHDYAYREQSLVNSKPDPIMSHQPVRVPFSAPHVLGDKWSGIPLFGPVTVIEEGSQDPPVSPSAPLQRVVMEFKKDGRVVLTLDSSTNDIDILNVNTWEGTVKERQNFLTQVGNYSWVMRFYAVGNTSPETFYYGNLEVVKL